MSEEPRTEGGRRVFGEGAPILVVHAGDDNDFNGAVDEATRVSSVSDPSSLFSRFGVLGYLAYLLLLDLRWMFRRRTHLFQPRPLPTA